AITEPDPQEQVMVEVGLDGSMRVNGQDIGKFDLAEKVHNALKNRRDKIVFVGFADDLKYGEAVSVIDIVKGAGAEKVALKTKDDQPAAGGAAGSSAPAKPTP